MASIRSKKVSRLKISRELVEEIFDSYKRCNKCMETKLYNKFSYRNINKNKRPFKYCNKCKYAKYECECGRTYTRSNYSDHIKSRLHANALRSKDLHLKVLLEKVSVSVSGYMNATLICTVHESVSNNIFQNQCFTRSKEQILEVS